MATLYWGGGTGTWSSTAVNNWFTDVGRTVPSTVAPTNIDDVIFDSASSAAAYTVTISTAATCRNWTVAGPASGSVTIAGTSTITVAGSISWATTGIIRTYSGTLSLSAASGTINLDFGGLALGGTVTWGPALNSTAVFTLLSNYTNPNGQTVRSGTLDTNGFNMTVGSMNASSTTYVRSILLRTGSHIIGQGTGGGVLQISATNLTFDAGTSTVTIPSSSSGMTVVGAITFYNLTLSGNTFSISYTTANLTVTNLFSLGNANNSVTTLLSNGFTLVVGTFEWWTIARISRSSRRAVITQTGQTATISATNFINFENVDLGGITAAGSAPWTTGTSIGDIGGNTGITFTTPKTVYWSNTAGGTWQSTSWATSSGGTPADANYPIAHDTVIIDDAGLSSGATINISSIGSIYVGSFDSSTRTLPWTFSTISTTNLHCSGDFKASSGTLTTGNTNTTLHMIGSGTLSSGGTALGFGGITIASRTAGTITLGSNLQINILQVTAGTLSIGAFNITASVFSSTGVIACGVSTGGGVINISGNNAVVINILSALAITGTLNINLTYSGSAGSRTLSVNLPSANVINYNITAGTDIVTLGNTIFYANNINFTGFSGSLGISTGVVIYGDITFSPTMITVTSNNAVAWRNDVAATAKTIDTKGITLRFAISLGGSTLGTQVWNLFSNYTSTSYIGLTNGVFNTNNYNMVVGSFEYNNTGVKTWNLGSSTITINAGNNATIWNANATNTTFNAGTSSIIVNQTVAGITSTFAAAGATFSKLYFTGSNNTSGVLAITGANTFNYFENLCTVPVTVQLPSSQTTTFGTLKLNGVRGRRVALRSSSTANVTIAKSGGGVSENDYLNLSYINAAATNTFYAGRYSTTIAGTSTNWVFNFFTKPKVGNALGFFH